MMGHEEAFELIPLYALDALEDAEFEAADGHITGCEACRAELERHTSVAASLTRDEIASPRIWERIAEELDRDKQANVVPLTREKEGRRTPLAWAVGIAAALALVFGGVLLGRATFDAGDTNQRIIAAADQTAADPESVVADFLVDDVSVARVVLGADGLGYVIPNEELEPLDASRAYQLWVINSEGVVISAGVLGNEPGPTTFTWSGGVSGFALTREVAGGAVSSAGDVVSVVET